MRRVVATLILFASCAAAQSMEGNIVNSVTGTGIAGVSVHLEPSGSDADRDAYDTRTDALGHFAFAQVKPGKYQFGFYSSAYVRAEGFDFPEIRITADQEVLRVDGRMTGMPSISGRVVSATGKGVARVQVATDGPALKMMTFTDETGRFEQHIPPGSYSLSVMPADGVKAPEPEPGRDEARVWTRVYYPGTTVREAASKLVVHPAEQIAGIELKLAAVPAHVVQGILMGADGTPAPDVAVVLYKDELRYGPHEPDGPTHEVKTNAEGAFEFPPVADGDWRIAAELPAGERALRALEWIEMAGHNIEDVKLRLGAPFMVEGRVVFETNGDGVTASAVAPKPPTVSLIPHAGRLGRESGAASWMLQPETMARAGFRKILFGTDAGITADPDRDGYFAFQSIYADSYRIAPSASPAGYYLDAVRVGDRDVAAAEVQLSAGTLPITVVYKSGGGVVRGTVEKCGSGAVLLIPADADRRWFGFLHSVRCDAADAYNVSDVRPGDYLALAFQGRDSEPSLDAGILQQARRITVKAGEAVTADLSAQ